MAKQVKPGRTSSLSARKKNPRSVIYIVLAILVFLSPVVLTHYKNVEQHRIAEQYSASVAKIPQGQRDEALNAAREYNTRLPEFGAVDPWVHGADTSSPAYADYQKQLAVDSTLARLRVPSVGIDLPVYHGTSNATLAHGIGHLYGTALPIGGPGTHAVLTGHTGLASMTMFDNLTHIKTGDVFTVEVMGETLAYQVDQITTVLPTEVENIRPEEGKDYLTLITCTPYGINSHRLLVRGQRVPVPQGHIDRTYTSPWQPWMIAAVVISVLALLYLLWWLMQRRKAQQVVQENEVTQ
ncbi:class C sortase [Corynebacterium tapiri]|uniref:Class C sortase n=1 Tax=Corynebacterium tapiri TaxID=1448266 RepID=A0A5C4U4D2_9CORY|nr:class C sortase [Corynebacterium tapiri]TNL96639.1 class C sortase [Corynebacterium tapiri]